jgi:hypothetical protein
MTKFYNYLNEENDVDVLISILKNDVDLKQYKEIYSTQRFLWRGINKNVSVYTTLKPRQDREPRDTLYSIHRAFDNSFQKKFGWKARSEGVFVVGNKILARTYGKPWIFIPLGKFKYIWSPTISDLYFNLVQPIVEGYPTFEIEDLFERIGLSEDDFKYWTNLEYEPNDKVIQDIIDTIVNKLYMDNKIDEAIVYHDRVEIMVKCNEYLIVEESYGYIINKVINEVI